nr:reverse transcriptase domain-containing protein [Tanacetum cinerariifolium]
MAISVISFSSDSSEESVRTSAGRVILFGIIPTTIPDTTPIVIPPTTHVDTTLTPTKIPIVSPIVPPSPDYTPASPNYLHASDMESDLSEDLSINHIPPLPAISPFLSSTDDSSDSDTPDTSLSPTHACADLLPPPKRIRSSDSAADLEDCSDESFESSAPTETSLKDDVVVMGSDEPYSEPDIDLEIQAKIDKRIAYADALRADGIYARVVVKTVAREEVETSVSGLVEVRVERVMHPAMSDDILKPAQEEGAIKDTYEMLGDLGHKIIATDQQSAVLSERIGELERDNTRLREALEARGISKNLEPLVEGKGEQEEENGDDYESGNIGNKNGGVNGNRGNGNRGNGNEGVNGNGNDGGNDNGNDNGNGNGNGEGNGYNFRGFMHVARECTYQDFLKYQPLNFNRTKGVVGLTRWFEKMETVFHISNCLQKYEKMKAEFWNLIVKGNDLTAYTRRFQDLFLLCTRMVPDEEDKRTLDGNQPGVVCYECGRPGHFRKTCPKLRNQNRRNKTGNKIGNKTANKTKSNEARIKAYANRGGGANPYSNVVIGLLGHPFDIDLMPVELGSFDVIIGMDWLAKYHAVIVCDKKIICIPYGDEMLIIQEVFPKDLPRLPPAQQVEFQIDLVPGAAPIARAPYRLAPAKMQELSTQFVGPLT